MRRAAKVLRDRRTLATWSTIVERPLVDATDPFRSIAEAVSFAARAHKHQLRKDKETPYIAHPVRVCLVIRHVFGIDDPSVLAAAVLHDTIEDTTTDYDDLAERFGTDVADTVAAMTKDMRLPEPEREPAYLKQLLAGGWQVAVCKLADGYDNLSDFAALPPAGQQKQLGKMAEYLEALRPAVPPEARRAFEIVAAKVESLKSFR